MGVVNQDATYGADQGAVADVINTDGVNGSVTVTSTAIEAKVGVSRLTNRKLLTIFNDGPITVYWGYSNTVTSTNGTPIFKSQFATWDIGDGLGVWLVTTSGTSIVKVTEAS